MVFDAVLKPVTGLLDWAGRRFTRGIVCHVRETKRIGGEVDPGVRVIVVAENPQGENAFVDAFDVEMLEPFQHAATKYEYRVNSKRSVLHLALNIPGHGVSQAVTVMASFHQPLPYTSGCRARITASGRRGFRRRWTEFSCDALTPT